MKFPLPLLIGILAVFILSGSFWYNNSACCTGTTATSSTSMIEKTAPATSTAAIATETGEIEATASNTEELEETTFSTIADRLKATALVLHFDPNSEELRLDDNQKQYLQDLYTYLEGNESAIISVIGHTDSLGDADNNVEISKERADFVRNYLIGNGVASEQIEFAGVGEAEPIANNDTEEGRAINRRVEINLK